MNPKFDTVLLVDDETTNNFINKAFLEKSRLVDTIYAVESAREAFSFLKSQVPDIILLDINMPALSGWDFLDQHTEYLAEDKKPIIVMLTCSEDPNDIEQAASNPHVAGLINKPLDVDKLITVLKSQSNKPA